MLWQEENSQKEETTPQTIVDMVFDMNCRCLPIDHAYSLSLAIQQALPWFEQEPQAGLHLIYGADSGNGWYRPDDENALLYLSRRTKLTLRLPQHRIADAQVLSGKTLDIAGYSLTVGNAKQKPLMIMPVLFARHILAHPDQDEEAFLNSAVKQIQQIGIRCRKALCGKSHRIKLPNDELFTRSLMIADLNSQESIILQEQGVGDGRKIGCGLFFPHKGIEAVSKNDE
ncbi:type I-MYXAN CRISPR-associated protein Cas6/Cmx6 [Candidatus Parabeggiatoa sp. HSG14]|uniref:type I-MYXAN CRISPR-associated protein Cas6/Cmx6 n=1 Tax=Candidatus Parabeggiatoa sp. HSG14 TaxID=3055593 RepID=UPI0025A6B2D2|nr:type I-MYXAN CRISPR-associated protein Cas6/Cmx6 [Thiotrichales bacterium HSG14]